MVINGKLTISLDAGRNIMTQLELTLLLGARSVRQRVKPSSNGLMRSSEQASFVAVVSLLESMEQMHP